MASLDPDCVVGGGDVTCTTTAGLAAGASISFDVELDVDADFAGLTLSNTAAITSSPSYDPDPTNDADTDSDDVLREADLGVTIGDSPNAVLVGEDVTYTLDVENLGPSDATDVDVADPRSRRG